MASSASPYFEQVRQYDNTVVAATGTTPTTITADTTYTAVSRSLVVLISSGGKYITETDEHGVRAIEPGEVVYTKQHLGDGPFKFDELTHATNDRSLVNDYNSDGTVDYDHTVSTWVGSGAEDYHVAGSEFRSIGIIKEITHYPDIGPELYAGTTGKRITFLKSGEDGHDPKYGEDRGNISRAVGGSSLWIENTSAATTFRCIIELVIIPRKDKDK